MPPKRTGVIFDPRTGYYTVKGSRCEYLGHFRSFDDAVALRKKWEEESGFNFARKIAPRLPQGCRHRPTVAAIVRNMRKGGMNDLGIWNWLLGRIDTTHE